MINQWNIVHGEAHQLNLDAVLWESHAAPECGERVQSILNEQLAVDHCDCAIGIFWTRIGTDTGVAPGGAVEEIRRILTHGNRVILNFSKAPGSYNPSDPEAFDKLLRRVPEFGGNQRQQKRTQQESRRSFLKLRPRTMQAFKIHKAIVDDYKNYLNSFTNIRDSRIHKKVQEVFEKGTFLAEPLLQFNPSFELGELLQELEGQGLVHGDLKKIFGSWSLYFHQVTSISKKYKTLTYINNCISGYCHGQLALRE